MAAAPLACTAPDDLTAPGPEQSLDEAVALPRVYSQAITGHNKKVEPIIGDIQFTFGKNVLISKHSY